MKNLDKTIEKDYQLDSLIVKSVIFYNFSLIIWKLRLKGRLVILRVKTIDSIY